MGKVFWVMVVLVGAGVKWIEKDYTRPPYQVGGVEGSLVPESWEEEILTDEESVKTVVVPTLS